jgi:hypothetical protein
VVRIADLLSGEYHPVLEHAFVEHQLLAQKEQLLQIFLAYCHTQSRTAATMKYHDLLQFVRECKIISQHSFPQAAMDIILQQAHVTKDVNFNGFLEVLVRIAHAKYADAHVWDRVSRFLEQEVYTYARRQQIGAEDQAEENCEAATAS